MSHETAESMPSLAHPIIVSSAQKVENDVREQAQALGISEDCLPSLPPFPEINLINWAAFTFSHLHWIGFIRLFPEAWKDFIVFEHEICHKELAHTSFSLRIKYELFRLYKIILTTFEPLEDEQEQIPVPLRPNLVRNELERQWGLVVRLGRASMFVEEIYAVRYSLSTWQKSGIITNRRRQKLIITYKEQYRKSLPFFAEAYDAFDFIVSKVGDDSGIHMIYKVLETLNPTIAFFNIIFKMCKTDPRSSITDLTMNVQRRQWNLSDEETNSLLNSSFEQTDDFFSNIMDELDPDDSRYQRTRLRDYAAMIEQEWRVVPHDGGTPTLLQDIQDDVAKFLFNSATFVLSLYRSDVGHHFCDPGSISDWPIQEIEYGNFSIVLEAIRQQLTQGKGLLCPFWMDGRFGCCRRRNKAFLEKVWKCTSDSSSRLWKRLGCLK